MAGALIKSPREIECMRRAGATAGRLLTQVGHWIRAGRTTRDIDLRVAQWCNREGVKPATLGYGTPPFPGHCCTSLNDVVCHGIPSPHDVLRGGDIINVDVTIIQEGWHGDTSATFYVGRPGPEAQHVTEVARHCLQLGIDQVRPGIRIGDIGHRIEEFAKAEGCASVTDFAAHGIGRGFHEPPTILHSGPPERGLRLKEGMTFTLEPMINLGTHRAVVLHDGWTAITADRKLSAQFEHTLLVTREGCEILTRRPAPLRRSEIW